MKLSSIIFLSAMWIAGLAPGILPAQTAPEPGYQVPAGDQAILSGNRDVRTLPCNVSAVSPQMGFDLRFHTGYTIRLPLEALTGTGNQLHVLLRVAPLPTSGRSFLLRDLISVPAVSAGARGETEVPGRFAVGPGRYRVDWLLRDRAGRVCSAHWTIEARLRSAYRSVLLPIPPDTAGPAPDDAFREVPPVSRNRQHPLHLKLLVNFSAGDNTLLDRNKVQAITSILRAVTRQSPFGRFTVVAFSTDQQLVFFRQPESARIDFPALGRAFKQLRFGTVDLAQIRHRDSAATFLARVLAQDLGPQQPSPDAILIISPKVPLAGDPKPASAGRPPCPVFYMDFNPDPAGYPWPGAMGTALKMYGAMQYTISAPRDLGIAMDKMLERLRTSGPTTADAFTGR